MPNDSLISARQVAVQKARRVVVKIGTGVLTASGGLFDRPRFDSLCSELARVASARQLVVVSSGAVALGVERLGLKSRPKEIPGKQAAAAVGQSRLMRLYDDALGSFDRVVAQVLLTHADIQSRTRYLNARHAMERLLERGAIPIINENDTVSVEELKFGDNDTLAGMVVDLVGADALVILTDIDGVYTADPRVDPTAKKLDELQGISDEMLAAGGESRSGVGTGGMASKLRAARRAGESGVPTFIVPGKQVGVLDAVLGGETIGTFIAADESKGSGRKRWIARDLQKRGELRVDDGAVKAIVDLHKSLLPSGVKEVRGQFAEGDAIDICDLKGRPFARGLAGYASDDLKRIVGVKSADIETVLGYKFLDEAVHRDDLVILGTGVEVSGGA
jgi:glutamate 5-kinase